MPETWAGSSRSIDGGSTAAFYDLAKVAINRLAWSQGHELASSDAITMAITPGWLRSEMMLEAFGVTEAEWTTAAAPAGFAASESPRYVGRAIAAIAINPDRHRWNQASVTAGDLATRYGFTDIDGTQPDAWRYMADAESDPNADPLRYR